MDEKFSASPVYQWTLEAGRTEGIAIGEAKGIAIGEAKAEAKAQMLTQVRQKVMKDVLERFSSLALDANDIVAMINDTALLLDLIVKLARAQSTEEAQELLLKAQPAG